ncbi:MAG: TolC family outer membrane protein [Pseudomonadota bacterium]
MIYRAALILAAFGCAASSASALSLVEAYEKARIHDPQYRAAFYNNEAGKENRIIGRANLLPQLSGSYNASKNNSEILANNRRTHPEYYSRAANIQLRQSLFNLDAYARYRIGAAQTKASAAIFDSEAQKLILRVTIAYVEAVFTDEQVELASASRNMYQEQNKVNARLFEKGEGTRTDMLETQARLDLAEAKLLEAKDNQVAARTTLASLIGEDVTALDRLGPNFRVRAADTAGFDSWKQAILDSNPEVQAQLFNVEAARGEVLQAKAGHSPRVDFVASYSKNASETINTLNQDSTVRSIGVQVNVPLYSGGSVSASARQAVARQERAKAELDAKSNEILVALRKDYDSVASSITRIKALEKAVESATLLIKATTQSIKGGVRINLDLLTAQEQLYVVQRDLAQARFNYLLGSLRMRSATGSLTSDDVREMAQSFR